MLPVCMSVTLGVGSGWGVFASVSSCEADGIDTESLRLTTQMWLDVCDRLGART